MKVSLNWVRFINQKYGTSANPVRDGVDTLVEKIGTQLGAVEEVVDLGKKYQGIVVVKVVSQDKHPNADKLQVVLIDDGKAVKNVKRNKDGLIQVVHGAPNVKEGMLAAWIPPGVAVPNTYDKEPLVLETRDIRGVASNGMLASAKELALSDEHEGILVLAHEENGEWRMENQFPIPKPGMPLTEFLGLDDHIIDIENKMFTHRPDCFGMLGIARELAGIQHQPFKSPSWYKERVGLHNDGRKNVLKLAVENAIPKLVPRFSAIAIKDVQVEPSPLWLRVRLTSVGIRPVNNIVDITNFYMYETAQPLHAYDYDKVKTGVLGVRLSKKGEQLELLGGKTIKLDAGAVLITDGQRPVGLGGVMGGAGTEVDGMTKNIILECANFDMTATRQTAMHYGLFTDAAIRFTKNQSPLQTLPVLAKAVSDIHRLAGGRVASPIVDDNHVKKPQTKITLSADFINSRLGLNLSAKEMQRLLQNVEFEVGVSGNQLSVQPPFWRTDIEIPEDIVEEIGRLYGYDKLPIQLPRRDVTPTKVDEMLNFKSRVREILSSAGANEVLTYSFVDDKLLQSAGHSPKDAYHVRNALSPDLQYYRPSLVPSLLEKIHPDIRAGYEEFAVFEIGKAHVKGKLDEQKLPKEYENLALVVAGKTNPPSAPYFAAKRYLEYLTGVIGIEDVQYSQEQDRPSAYESQRSAWVMAGQHPIGIVGEPSPRLRVALKLPAHTAQFELSLTTLLDLAQMRAYQLINRFPSAEQDITLQSRSNLSYAELTAFMTSQLQNAAQEHGYDYRIEALDIYLPPKDKSLKRTTWRLTLWHADRTLTTAEINQLLAKISAKAAKKLNVTRI